MDEIPEYYWGMECSFGGFYFVIEYWVWFYYDYSYDYYVWLVQQGASMPPPCNDEGQTRLRNEYIRPELRQYVPACEELHYRPTTFNFGWNLIQSHGTYFDYAMFQNALASGLEELYADTAYTITTDNRIYSSPLHQDYVSPGAPDGRHIYGDAADIHTFSESNWNRTEGWVVSLSPTPCAEPIGISTINHYHIDYRTVDGEANEWGACPTGWSLPRS